MSEQLTPPWDVNPTVIKPEDSIYRRMSLTAPRNRITPKSEAARIAPAVKSLWIVPLVKTVPMMVTTRSTTAKYTTVLR